MRSSLDWKEYYAAIEEDLNTGRYLQHCATFVLTLLPNLRWLQLPEQWNYGAFAASDQLLDTVVSKARLPGSKSSLSQVTLLGGNECEMSTEFDIDMAAPFLTLPYFQYFEAQRCKSANSYRNTAGKYAALENVVFVTLILMKWLLGTSFNTLQISRASCTVIQEIRGSGIYARCSRKLSGGWEKPGGALHALRIKEHYE